MEWIREENYEEQMNQVMASLKRIKESGAFEREAGQEIHYELFPVEDALGWLVISHGFTESIAKYGELVWYFTQAGYSVAMLEHRGHGRSYRDVKENWLTNVDRFEDYRDDLICFIREVVNVTALEKPVYVLGHSMGGAIAAHVMEYAPELLVERYILSCPMVSPQTGGLPKEAARMISGAKRLAGCGRRPIMGAGPFDPEEQFDAENGCCSSEVRFDWYHKIQCRHEDIQNSACTYNWLSEAIKQTSRLLNAKQAAQVKVPVLMIQAGKDNMVENEAQDRLFELLPYADQYIMPDAKHEIFRGRDEEIEEYVEVILGFLAEEA